MDNKKNLLTPIVLGESVHPYLASIYLSFTFSIVLNSLSTILKL